MASPSTRAKLYAFESTQSLGVDSIERSDKYQPFT
jgi:hypothetical protein